MTTSKEHPLKADMAYFRQNLEDLLAHHEGKWALIQGGAMVDTFDSFDNAAKEAARRFGDNDHFLIRQVIRQQTVPTLPASVLYVPQ